MSEQLKIYTIENKNEEEILRKRSLPVDIDEFKDPKLEKFIENLLYTAQHSEDQGNVLAGGIAACQVGQNKRIFFILNYDTNEWQLFINPDVIPLGYTKISSKEGCLSVPNREEEIMRYKKVRIKYQNNKGERKTEKYSDLNAISIQHELDHLDGILFIDRIK